MSDFPHPRHKPTHKPHPFRGYLNFHSRKGRRHHVSTATYTPSPVVASDQDQTLTVNFTQLPASSPPGTAPTVIPPIVVPVVAGVVPTASIPCNPGDTITAVGALTNVVGTTTAPTVSAVDPTPPPTDPPTAFTGAITFS